MGTIIGRRFGWLGALLALALVHAAVRAGDEARKDQAGSGASEKLSSQSATTSRSVRSFRLIARAATSRRRRGAAT